MIINNRTSSKLQSAVQKNLTDLKLHGNKSAFSQNLLWVSSLLISLFGSHFLKQCYQQLKLVLHNNEKQAYTTYEVCV